MRSAAGSLLLAAVALLASCAHVEPPTGGPEDKEPPRLIATRPDTLAVLSGLASPVVFLFEERISEQRLEEAVMVSPRTSPVEVSHRGDELRVSLRRGWQPGLIYQVTVQPMVQDLFGNRLAAPIQLVFSTGPAIPDTRLQGTVIDRITGKPETEVRVEAIRRADSLVYATATDSAGLFQFARVPEGEYRVRAFKDLNRNRALDSFEAGDTAVSMLAAGDSARVQLSVVLPDTLPPRATEARLADGRVELQFDDYLDPAQPLSSGSVRITGPDGAEVPVAAVRLQQSGSVPPAAAGDTSRRAEAQAPLLPSQTLVIELGEGVTLTPGATYQVLVRGVRNVVGLAADARRELTVPAAAADPRGAEGTAPATRARSAPPGPKPLEP